MRILIWILLAYLVYRMVRGAQAPRIKKEATATGAKEFFQDPVCGTYLAEDDAVVGNLEGKRYHFCSMDCLKKFEQMQR